MVVPRDPPPLYTWEVFPGLYPPLPTPRRPRVRLRRAAQVALVGVAALGIVLGGLLVVFGAEALGPGTFVVSGTVTRSEFPIGAPSLVTVVLTTDSGAKFVNETATGRFAFSNVPAGGISLNVTASGYAPVNVFTFASNVYNAGTTGLTIELVPGSPANATTETLSPFPDLETFVASIGSGAMMLGLVAGLGAVAAVITRRSDRPAVGVVAGAAGLLSPVALYLLSLGGVFPLVVIGTAVLGAFGAFALSTRCLELVQSGPDTVPN